MSHDNLDHVRRIVVDTRAAQGLPPTVEDDTVLGRVADAMRAATVDRAA